MIAKLWTRKCRGCTDRSPHSHHLTQFGRLYFRHFAGGRK